MRCDRCDHDFVPRRVRSSRGTGGSSPPTLMAVAWGVLTVGLAASAGAMWSGALDVLYVGVMSLIWGIAGGAWLISYTDSNVAVCPKCRAGAGTVWPWTR